MKRKPRILVLGDAMLDTYIYGNVSRVSPEAPIPVVCPTGEDDRPGGAANVACNAAALGAQVTALFVLGADSQAQTLMDKLTSYGVDTTHLYQSNGQHTINKVRLLGNGQQIARVDVHDGYMPDDAAVVELLARFRAALGEQDVVVLSDYGKGTCTETVCSEVIRMSREQGKPVIVDPKGTAWDKYRGATVITPNMKELNTFSGKTVANEDAAIETAYRGLGQELGIRYLLLTRSEQGMSLLEDDTVQHMPTQAQKVRDVSGAGDTVVAALAYRLGEDSGNIWAAVRFANAAAGVVVSKPGTATVTMDEVVARMLQAGTPTQPRIFTAADTVALDALLEHWRSTGKTVVTTNGCFDVLHIGHLRVLQEAKRQGDRLVAAINADTAVRRLKGSQRPVNSEKDRAAMLLALRCVDAVVIFDPAQEPDCLTAAERRRLTPKAQAAATEAPMALMRRIHSDVHVKGGDYAPGDVPEAIFAKRLVLVPLVEGHSTTAILEHMKG